MNPVGDPADVFMLLLDVLIVVALVCGIWALETWNRDEREKRIARRVAEELEEKRRVR